jgi:hypothetical protein
MPLLGTRGSGSVRAFGRGGGVSFPPTSTFALIQTYNLTGNSSVISFADINPNYTNLYLAANARSDGNTKLDFINITMNNDSTTSNYSSGFCTAAIENGQPVVANSYARFTSNAGIRVPGVHGAQSTANFFGAIEVDFINISNASNYKTAIAKVAQIEFGANTCCQNAGHGHTGVSSGQWRSTAAISAISLRPAVGSNFVSGSTFSLYGITRQGGFGS